MRAGHRSWPEVSLGEICVFKYGKGLPDEKRAGGDVPVFGSNGLVGWHNEAITKGMTVIVGRKGSFGEINFSVVPCWPIDTTYYVDETATKADLRWLGYRLAGLGFTDLNKAATIPGLNREDAYRQRLLLPPLAEQRRIAELLDRAEVLRDKRRAAVPRLDTLTQALFVDLFGSSAQCASRFPSVQLGDAAQFIDYRGISPNKQPYGVRLVTARNIKRGWFQNEPQEFIPEDEYDSWMRRGIPRTGDVLFTTEGHTLGSAAKLPRFEKAALAQRLIALQPRENVSSDYLLQVVLGQDFQNEVFRRSTGSAAKGISSRQLAEIIIPFPPLRLQVEFARRVAAVDKLRTAHHDSLGQLDALVTSLQHRAFRGEL